MTLVHVDEHRSMCPDPELRRGAMRALAELPGVQVLEPTLTEKLVDDRSHV